MSAPQILTSHVEEPTVLSRPREKLRQEGRVVAALVVLTHLVGAVSVLTFPLGSIKSDTVTYAELSAHRDALWTWYGFAAANLVLSTTVLVAAVWFLTPARGRRLLVAGGALSWLGAAFYTGGAGAMGALSYFGSAPELGEAGRTFVDLMNSDMAHLYGFLMPGALAMYIGNILLAIALLRARTVPRWAPVLMILGVLLPIPFPAGGVVGLLTEGPFLVGATVVGVTLWQRTRVESS